MKDWVRRVLSIGMGLVVFAGGGDLLGGQATAASFDPDPVLGDRKVTLTWQPDSDDPVFTGNLKLFPQGQAELGLGEIGFLGFTRDGEQLWAWDAGRRTFILLQDTPEGGYTALDTLAALDAGYEPLSFAVHPTGSLLAAGLENGQVALWRPLTEAAWMLEDAHDGPVRGIAFRPLAGERDSMHVTIGDDGLWRRWIRPGMISDSLPPEMAFSSRPTAIALNRTSSRLAIGTETGRVWLQSFDNQVRIDELEHDGAEIVGFSFSEDGLRLASAAANGTVILWTTAAQNIIGRFEPENPGRIDISFTPNASSFITYAFADGRVGFIDGHTGRSYGAVDDLGHDLTAYTLSREGVTGLFGGPSGLLEWWYQGQCIPSEEIPECFGGYRVYRGLYPDQLTERMSLLRVYDFGDTTWGWTSVDTLRVFTDPDSVISEDGDEERVVAGPHNGVPFYYSLVKYYWRYLDGATFIDRRNTVEEGYFGLAEYGEPVSLQAREDPTRTPPLLDEVYVVPNPYIEGEEGSSYGPLSEPLVRFVNLPERATIRIYTSSGDLVRKLEHVPSAGDVTGGACPWNLRNEHDRAVTAGLYVYSIETPGGESTRGFLTLVR